MDNEIDRLLGYLEVEQIDTYLFSGRSPEHPRRVFGGQVLAQALNAATSTVADARIAHSMHAYFLRPGAPDKTIVYEVVPVRDGNSFTTRNVVAKQLGVVIFTASISYHIEEAGLSHQFECPPAPAPETLERDADRWSRLANEHPGIIKAPKTVPIERWSVEPRDYLDPQPREPRQQIWFRVPGNLGNDLSRHQTVLAFISDFGLLGTALLPHPHTGMDKHLQSASLDHALWFHRPFRADDHLLYCLDSPSAEGARGFSRGTFYNREGLLIASSAQESLLRLRHG